MDDITDNMIVRIDADASGLREELRASEVASLRFGRTLSRAFEGLVLKGKSLGDTLRSLALSLSRLVLNAAFKPLEKGLSSLFSGLFSGSIKPFAQGGVLHHGLPVPFASGCVIASPISFPLAGGRLGIAGERGAEAIMPLARGPDGRLGVRADGSGVTQITVNVTTADAESFRRSETQVAAMLSRAIGRGQRNL